MSHNLTRGVGWVLLALGGLSLVGAVRSCRQVSYTAAQALDSLEAIRDTLRVQRVVLRGTRDTLQVWQRRAVQAELKRDALDQALRATRRLQAVVTVTPRPLDTVLTGVSDTDESDSVRIAEFVGYDPPYRLAARVWIPTGPPWNLSMIILSNWRSVGSNPRWSTSSISKVFRAASSVSDSRLFTST